MPRGKCFVICLGFILFFAYLFIFCILSQHQREESKGLRRKSGIESNNSGSEVI